MTKISKISILNLFGYLFILADAIAVSVYDVFFFPWEDTIIANIILLAACSFSAVYAAIQLSRFKSVYQKGHAFAIRNLIGFGIYLDKENLAGIAGESRQIFMRYNIYFAVVNITLTNKKKIELDGRYMKNLHEIRRIFKEEFGRSYTP